MKMGKQEILTRVTLKKLRAAFFALIMIGAVFVGLLGNVSATIFFQDDMESGIGGWTFDGFWHQVDSSDPLAPFWNISHSPDHSWWYGQDATGDYDNGFTNTGNLTSPVIDLTTAAIGNLTFWTWYWTEGGTNYDQMWIQISEDAGPFIDEYQINPTSMGTWLEMSINITSHIGHNIQIRFYFDTVDDFANDYQGWYIDDLEVNDIPLPPAPTIEPPHSDYGLDTDGNGLFNYLVVNVTVNITVAGDYIIEGSLVVPSGGPWIDGDINFTFLNTGVQIVELRFEGWIIRNSMEDGPYEVQLELYDDSWNLLDSDIHTTGSYTYDQFELPPATFEPPHSDYGLDTDGDGYFNYLVVNVTVNVSVAGDYIIEGYLYDISGPPEIDYDINFTFLNAGIQTVQLWFDGTSIYTRGADGGYDVELYLYDDSWNFLDFDMYTTNSYTYDQFQPPPALFEPPYSDYGLDTDGDGYFNYLVVNVTVNVSVADAYRVEGWLYDSSMTITIGFDSNYTFLNTGIQVIQLYFDGTSIYNLGIDGPYEVELELTDSLWNLLDTDWYTTNSYIYDQFQPPSATFQPPYSDYGLDTDGDGYFNYLVVNVTVNIGVADFYEVYGDLWGPMNWIDFYSNYTFLNTGVQVVQLYFDGSSIYTNDENGTYTVYLELYDDLGSWLDSDTYTTNFYTYDQFQPPAAAFSPPYSDYGLDTDGDGFFNYLVVNVTVDVSIAGDYTVEAVLLDSTPAFIEFIDNTSFLNTGVQVVQFYFSGPAIYSHGIDGPYMVFLELFDNMNNSLDTDMYTTGFYTFSQFQAGGAVFNPPHSDYGLDTDSDGYFNYLVVNVSVNVMVAGDYTVEGTLFDPLFNPIDFNSSFGFLNTGIQFVQLYFDGMTIFNNGQDGTYTVYLELFDNLSVMIDADIYTTAFYSHIQFQRPASLQPPYSDYGLDTDGDGYFNYLVVNVTVNVSMAGDYEVLGELYNASMVVIDSDSNFTSLNTGLQVVQLYFDGMSIYNNGENGTYTVWLDLYDDSMNWLDSDMYITGIYTYDEFQPPPVNPWATATGPVSFGTNNPSPTITYNYGNSPTNVQIYWSNDGGLSWNMWGTDNTVDGSWPAGSPLPASGTYYWSARAMGGPSEPIPSGPGDIEAGSYVLDLDAPWVVSTNPVNGDTGVPVNQDIVITFNETMDTTSFIYTIEPNPGGLSEVWSGVDTIVTISHTDFAMGTRYWVNITAVTDLAGNNLNPLPYSFYFDTTTTATTATATGPVGGPTNVAGITITYTTSGGPASAGLWYTTDTSSPYTWNFIGTDSPADGNYPWIVPVDGSYGWFANSTDEPSPTSLDIPEASYYIYDSTQPEVVSTIPINGDTGVLMNQVVVITFNETMNNLSLTYTIEPNPGGLSEVWSGGDTIVTISHTDFAMGTRYWVNITAITDLAGNNLNPLPYSFYFDTVTPGTTATATGPVGGPTNVAGITITYTTTGGPASVDLYYTTDTVSPYTWNLIGTDTPADGNYPWTVPADGSYGWFIVSPDETAPTSLDLPEASYYIYDSTQPEVLSTNPANATTGVPVAQDIVITFNETMIPGTFTYTIEPNPGGLSEVWSGGDTIVTISHTDFAMGTRYWVNITAVTDLAGNDLNPLPYSFYFDTTTLATTATATGPVGGPTNVAGITITYTTGGTPASVDLYYTTELSAPYTWTLIGTDTPADGNYPWTVPADGSYGWFAKSPDEAVPLSSDAPEASYYIYDSTSPEVVSTVPVNAITGVLVDQDIVITFNETMVPGTFTYTIEPNPGGLSEVWSGGDTIVTISHTDFALGTRYWVNITAVTDLAGNSLNPLPYSFYFDTTIFATTATVTGPVGGPSNVAGITITYTTTGSPATIDLYYTTNTVSPYTWTLIGTDSPADGTYPWTVPSWGSYGWIAKSPDEAAPTSSDSPEASYYIYDGTIPTSDVSSLPAYQTSLSFDVTYTADDVGGSNVKEVELWYQKDGGSWTLYNTYIGGSWTVTFTATSDGEYNFYTRARDNANNYEDAPTSPDADTKVDTTPPTVDGGLDITENSQFTQDASASDDGSGIATYEWTQESGPGTITFGDDDAEDTTVSADTDGTYVIRLTVTDLAGNSDYDEFTLVWDTTSPTVTTATPTGTEVSVTSTITITFNEAMNHASVQNAFNFTDGTTVWTIANGSVSWAGNVMTFTPTIDLSYGTSYTVNIGTGAQDQVGNGLGAVYTWSFTIAQAPDTTSPTVSSVSLTGTKVEVTNKLSITFDEPMDHASVEDAITITPDIEIINYSWVGNTLTITFETDLEYGTEYTVTIGTGAEDEAGNAIEDPYTWQFTTKEKEEEAGFPLWIIALIVIIIIVILLILFLMKGKRKPEGLPEEKAAEIEGKPEEELGEEVGITEGEGLEEKAEEEIGAETGEGEVEKPLEEMAEEEKKELEEL